MALNLYSGPDRWYCLSGLAVGLYQLTDVALQLQCRLRVFAAIPLFMLFIQLSWNICLFGAGISFVRQHETELADQKRAPMTQKQTRQQLADETLDRIHDLISQYRRQEEEI